MKIERLFTRKVVHAPRSMPLDLAAKLMREEHVGTLVVTADRPNDDRVLGIVTDRDLVLQAMAEGFSPGDLTLEALMTPRVATVYKEADVHEALELMRTSGVRRLVVTGRHGSIQGVISIDDIIDGMAADLATLAEVLKSERAREGAVFPRTAGETVE